MSSRAFGSIGSENSEFKLIFGDTAEWGWRKSREVHLAQSREKCGDFSNSFQSTLTIVVRPSS